MKTAVFFGVIWSLLLAYVLIAMIGKGLADLVLVALLSTVGIAYNVIEYTKCRLAQHLKDLQS